MVDSDLDLARELVGAEFANNASSSNENQRVREITKIIQQDSFKDLQVCIFFQFFFSFLV
jgi:hypothetical protein